jgi:hypothetical protein
MKPGEILAVLRPGERVEAEIEFPPEIEAALDRGARLEMVNGPTWMIRPGHYRRELVVLLDGVQAGSLVLEYGVA